MKPLSLSPVALAFVALLSCSCRLLHPKEASTGSYHLLKEIPIAGAAAWDYLSVDAEGRRLYVAHGTNVAVLDLDKETLAGIITNTPGVHGFAPAHKLGLGYASNGRQNRVSIVDLSELRTLAHVPTGANPDAILYEPLREEVYAFNGRSNSVTVIEARLGKVVTTIPLPGKPEFAVADSQAGRIYCNIEDKSEVAVIDIASHQVVESWPLTPGEGPSGLAIDLKAHRLFAGCGNKLMVMLNSANGKVLATVPIGEGVDAVAFDPITRLAFSSNGEGTTTIAREATPGTLHVLQTLTTAPGARTLALDPDTHRIYLATAQFEPAPDPAPGEPAARPHPLPGTFKLLVYGM